jgi:glycerol dehydrogenase
MPHIEKSARGFGAPSRYIQGPGEIENLLQHTQLFGKSVFAVIDVFFFKDLTAKFQKTFAGTDSTITTEKFAGEITVEEIDRVTAVAKPAKPDVIVGIGGGKTLDTAKAVADNFKSPVVIIPTTASTDAPCSALSVIYKANGEHSHARFYKKNPDLVLVDSQIIAKAPIRYLIAGMGDALSTYFEALANDASDTANYINFESSGGYRRTRSAMVVSKLCYDTLLEDGLKAKLAAEKGVCTEALENIIEATRCSRGSALKTRGARAPIPSETASPRCRQGPNRSTAKSALSACCASWSLKTNPWN